MLTNTFCHIPSIGPGTERKLWDAGITTWEMFASTDDVPMSAHKRVLCRAHLVKSSDELTGGNANYFTDLLATREHWRLFPHFRERIAYLDIETTGLGLPDDYITSIALYDGVTVRTYVHGQNLDDFADDIADYRLIVTYNGKSFDVPFIRRYLRLPMQHAHIDLMYVLRSLGYRGGLKGCEHQLGLDRGELEGVDGAFAVLLWHDYHDNGNEKALETMLAYNVQDVVNLETLLTLAYNMKVGQTPFADTHEIALPQSPKLPFKGDPGTIKRLKEEHPHYGWWG